MRRIRRFFGLLRDQLNLVAGIGGVGAVLLALAGLGASGNVRIGLISAGLLVVSATIVWSIIRAWPPKTLSPERIEGLERPISELSAIDPPIPALGILGEGAVGKTTLKHRVLQLPMPRDLPQTQRVTMRVCSLVREPTIYFALLDGRGDMYRQQSEIADHASIVVVLYDHNDIENVSPNDDRLASHRRFAVQLRNVLVSQDPPRQIPVHLLLNKKDLWSQATQDEQRYLRDFFKSEVDLWFAAFGDRMSHAEHSNDSQDDIARLIQVVKESRGQS